MSEALTVLSPKKADLILALARRIVPEVSSLEGEELRRFLCAVDDVLAMRGRSVRRQFLLFLTVIRWLPLLRHFRRFDRLPPETQDLWLGRLQDSPVHPLRAGIWGVKTLIFVGYYGDPGRWDRLGYTPSPAGNAMLRRRETHHD